MIHASRKGDAAPDLQNQLLAELQIAEESKKSLNLQSSADGQTTTEAFALRVFDAADAADRAAVDSSSQAAVIQKFYASALFLDVCAQFYDGELPPDLAEKARYARFRVVKIREGLKQGVPSYPAGLEGAPTPAVAPGLGSAPAASVAAAASSAPSMPRAAGAREEAQKKTEMASSALDFGDVPTARKCLLEALQLLS